jgi:hypothetical protein
MGLAGAAVAQGQIQDSPVHAVPADAGPQGDLTPGPIARSAVAEAPSQTEALNGAAANVASAGPWVAPLGDQLGHSPAASEAAAVPAQAAVAAPAGAALSQDESTFFSSLGHRITDSASVYETFVRKAGAIDPAFHDGAGVRAALRTGADYQPRQFQEGIVAFAALLALRDQGFVDGVRAQTDPELTERLAGDPRSVLAIPGAERAAADVTAVLRAQGATLQDRGAAITQAAYDVQAKPWSRQPVADAVQALAAEKAEGVETHAASTESEKLLLHTVLTAPQGAQPVEGSISPQVLRGLALAALAVRGRTGDREEARFQGLMHDEISAACLNMVKMNLDQCLAAAGPHYEHVFCVGRHAVGETAKCVSNAATGAGEPSAPLLPRQLTASVERYGPEAAASYGYAPAPGDDDGPATSDQRRRGDSDFGANAEAPDRPISPPADYAPAYARRYARSYTPAPAYAQSGAQSGGPSQRGAYAQDRYQEPPTDDRYAEQEQGRYPETDQDQHYADSRQPW